MKEPGERTYGSWGWIRVPYSREIFGFHWFNFYNAICFQIILGAPVVLLAKELGASSFILGIIASFTPLLTTLQLPAARHLGRHSYRSFALMGWGLRTVFIAISAIVPLLSFFSAEVRLGLLVASLFFFNVLRGISTAAFLPWIAGIVPSAVRGRFISVDHTFIYAGSLLTMLISSLLMSGQVAPSRYAMVMGIAVVSASISLFYLSRAPDAEHRGGSDHPSEPVSLRRMADELPFRNSILFNLIFVTVAGGLGVFPVEYLRDQAHFTPSMIYLLSTGTFLGPMVILQSAGSRMDRFGSIPTIRLAILVFAGVLLLWFVMSAGVISPGWRLVLLLNVLGGMAMAVFNMANLQLGMAVVPEAGKNHFFAVATVITNCALGLVPVFWGWLLDSLGGLDLVEGPFHLRRHSVYFLGITLLSLATLLASRILIEPGRGLGGKVEG